MVGLLGEKFTFSTPLGQPDFQESQTNSNSIKFELCFYFKYSRSYKVYDISDKTFETDFSSQSSIVCSFDYNLINHKKLYKSIDQHIRNINKMQLIQC